MIVEMVYFEGNGDVGFESVMSATEIANAFKSGNKVIFHTPAYSLCNEAYLELLGYEGPRTNGPMSYPANFIVASGHNLSSDTNFNYFTSTTVSQDDKVQIIIVIFPKGAKA